MIERWWPAAVVLLSGTGCVVDDLRWSEAMTMPLVSAEGGTAPTTIVPDLGPVRAPANEETARRVCVVARQILDKNEAIGLRPHVLTVGVPSAEIFHRGQSEVVVTEGLVRRCGDDEALAAVLCLELGKMASEREALTAPQVRQPEHLPPLTVAVGNEGSSPFGAADGTAHVEMVRYDRERHRSGQLLSPPAPEVLARSFLKQAGYKPESLDTVAPLLRAAEANSELEKQLSGGTAGH